MKCLLTLLFISGLSFAQAPECPRACDLPELPPVPGIENMRDIREHTTGECTEVSEIVVTAPNPDDPCNFENISRGHFNDPAGGVLAWSSYVQKTYPGVPCQGRVVDNLCYVKTNNLYARSGSVRMARNIDGGINLTLKKSAEPCSGESCAYPYEQDEVSFGIDPENIFDTQKRENTIIECRPENCYSVSIHPQSFSTPGGNNPGYVQTMTVTRESDGSVRTRLFVNGVYGVFTSRVTTDGEVGEGKVRQELIGKEPDTFRSCLDPFSERRSLYFPKP